MSCGVPFLSKRLIDWATRATLVGLAPSILFHVPSKQNARRFIQTLRIALSLNCEGPGITGDHRTEAVVEGFIVAHEEHAAACVLAAVAFVGEPPLLIEVGKDRIVVGAID